MARHETRPARLALAGGETGTLARRLGARLREPLYREGYLLVLSVGVSSALGLAYWMVAARAYDVADVGRNAAAISALILLGGLAPIGLVGVLTRFLPRAGHASWRLVAGSYAAGMLVAVAGALIFLAVVDELVPSLAFLADDAGFAVWFVASCVGWAFFGLQDAVLTGVRRAAWVPIDNTLFALAKLVLLLAFVGVAPTYGIFASWSVGLVLPLLLISALLVGRLLPRHVRETAGVAEPVVGGVRRFAALEAVGGGLWLATTTMFPLVVTGLEGAEANAYFALAWAMTIPLYLVASATGQSLVVSTVRDRTALTETTRRVFWQTSQLVVPGAVVLALAAPWVLGLLGEEYGESATTALRLLALSAIPNVVVSLYTSAARAARRPRLIVLVRALQFGLVVGGGTAALAAGGIDAAAAAWLAGQSALAVGLLAAGVPGRAKGELRIATAVSATRAARNAAAATGALTALGRLRHAGRRREQRRDLEAALEHVAPTVDGRDWVVLQVLATSTDRAVGLVGPPGGAAQAVLKVASGERAACALERETDFLAAGRTAPYARLLPELLADGLAGTRRYALERKVPGEDARVLLRRPGGRERLLELAGDAVAVLHDAGPAPVGVGPDELAAWVDGPGALVAPLCERGPDAAAGRAALGRLLDELRASLAGRRLAVGPAHGDLAPGNVLIAPGGDEVAAIVDWELWSQRGLPQVDLATLALTSRAEADGRELGEVVLGLAGGGGLDEAERRLLARPDGLGTGAEDVRALVHLAWLHHVAAAVRRAERFEANGLWLRSNVDAVVHGR